MSTKEFKPYTYLIGWSSLNKFYYGVQYGSKANPSNLWNSYFTSSKYVKEFRELYGEPDIIQVRKTFETKEQAIQYEFKVIKRLNCVRSEQWLNRSLAGQKFYNDHCSDEHKQKISLSKQNITSETKNKISIANTGKIRSNEFKANLSVIRTGQTSGMRGKILSTETKLKMSIAKQNITEETRKKYSISATGRKHTNETKLKISESSQNKIFTDEHRKNIGIASKGRIHSEKTKQKISISNTGKSHSEETKQKMSLVQKGLPKSEEAKNKMSDTAKKRKKFECPYCQKLVTKNMLSRWHNANCKSKV